MVRDCCSHQEDTFGDLFGELLNNYIPFWVFFAIATFFVVLFKFFWQTSADKKVKND